MKPQEFADKINSSFVLDTQLEAFATAHVPGALEIWSERLSAYAGWFLSADTSLLLVTERENTERIITELARMGYDRVSGYLGGGMLAWEEAGFETESVATVSVPRLCSLLDSGSDTWILDVRSIDELKHDGEIPGAHNIHILGFEKRIDEVPRDRKVYIFCGSGIRSMIAASVLRQQGWTDLAVVLGGFAAWSSVSCPISHRV